MNFNRHLMDLTSREPNRIGHKCKDKEREREREREEKRREEGSSM